MTDNVVSPEYKAKLRRLLNKAQEGCKSLTRRNSVSIAKEYELDPGDVSRIMELFPAYERYRGMWGFRGGPREPIEIYDFGSTVEVNDRLVKGPGVFRRRTA